MSPTCLTHCICPIVYVLCTVFYYISAEAIRAEKLFCSLNVQQLVQRIKHATYNFKSTTLQSLKYRVHTPALVQVHLALHLHQCRWQLPDDKTIAMLFTSHFYCNCILTFTKSKRTQQSFRTRNKSTTTITLISKLIQMVIQSHLDCDATQIEKKYQYPSGSVQYPSGSVQLLVLRWRLQRSSSNHATTAACIKVGTAPGSSASIELPKQSKNLGITDTSSAQEDPLLKKRKINTFCTAQKSGRQWLEYCQSTPSQMHFVWVAGRSI